MVVVGYPSTDLLESVDCLFRDCERLYFPNADNDGTKLNCTTPGYDRFSSWIA